MREVTQFVVVFPDRLIRARAEERELLLTALGREYPHYRFDVYPGRSAEPDAFGIIPVMGRLGDGEGDSDEVYMCSPLDPKVIPDIVKTLQTYEAVGALVH